MPSQAYADRNFEWDYNEDDPSEFGKA
jgi:hypothetical protein